ncbi:hypothetical protein ILUMI_16385 [Ignelater luminosus]|uniref:Uncharacterized protein n=1 Tax=Ignelater luminosus TaxID=2038154 RepID=A0A8K0CSE4_IGNLU|nr:hypothetical protein ILUMI_16385 [Ignelater luminosus]
MNTLYKAIQHNEESISSPEVDVNKQNSKGRTPLLHCLKRQRSDRFILVLLESKCDVTLSDRNKTTPLFIALTDRRLAIASQLIKMGADLTEDLKISNKYLYDSIRIRDWNFVWFLLQHTPNLVHFLLRGLQSRKVELDSKYALLTLLVELDKYLSDDPDKKRSGPI